MGDSRQNLEDGAKKMAEAQDNKGSLRQAYDQIDKAMEKGEVINVEKLTSREKTYLDMKQDGKELSDLATEPTSRRLPSGRGR
ncbi:MAG: hypothetical protein CV089_08790 [Nitrospira sp. WS110]|nr:hypothetical protein [Nitrospira sp. WS110]